LKVGKDNEQKKKKKGEIGIIKQGGEKAKKIGVSVEREKGGKWGQRQKVFRLQTVMGSKKGESKVRRGIKKRAANS